MITTKLFAFILVFLFLSIPIVYAKPQVDDVPLKKFTQMTVKVPVGMGVKFTFPYILNDNDYDIPFSLLITNPLFKTAPNMSTDSLGATNHIVVFIDPDKVSDFDNLSPKIGNMFLNIAGYQITVELIGDKSSKKFYSDFNFTLSKKEKEDIIQNLVKQRTRQLELNYIEKIKKNDQVITSKALILLAEIMDNGLKYEPVNETVSVELDNGDKVSLVVEDMIVSGKYTAIPFEVSIDERANNGVTIKAARVFTPDDSADLPKEINGTFDYDLRVEPDKPVRGVFVYSGIRHSQYNFNLLVGNKPMELTW